MKINPKKVNIYLKSNQLVSILIIQEEIKTRNKIKVLGKCVDTYSIDPDISEDFTKVYSGSVDTYSRERNLKVFHSPCEIAYLYCSMAYALSHRELIEIP